MASNYYEGNSVFTSLSSIFGNPTSGNTSESVPVSSSIMGSVKNALEKQVFGIPVWVIVLAVIVVIVIAMVML